MRWGREVDPLTGGGREMPKQGSQCCALPWLENVWEGAGIFVWGLEVQDGGLAQEVQEISWAGGRAMEDEWQKSRIVYGK